MPLMKNNIIHSSTWEEACAKLTTLVRALAQPCGITPAVSLYASPLTLEKLKHSLESSKDWELLGSPSVQLHSCTWGALSHEGLLRADISSVNMAPLGPRFTYLLHSYVLTLPHKRDDKQTGAAPRHGFPVSELRRYGLRAMLD